MLFILTSVVNNNVYFVSSTHVRDEAGNAVFQFPSVPTATDPQLGLIFSTVPRGITAWELPNAHHPNSVEKIWSFLPKYNTSTAFSFSAKVVVLPGTQRHVLVVQGQRGHTMAIDARSGQTLWEAPSNPQLYTSLNSPSILDSGKLVTFFSQYKNNGSPSSQIVVYDLLTGLFLASKQDRTVPFGVMADVTTSRGPSDFVISTCVEETQTHYLQSYTLV